VSAGDGSLELIGRSIDKADETAEVVLLEDIRDMFEERGVDRMASAEIVEALGKRDDRPWSEWKDDKPITPRQLARLLEPFAVSPTTIWSAGRAAKGYLLASFADAFARCVAAQDTAPNGSKGMANRQESANPNGLTDEKPVSLEVVWVQNNSRLWPAAAKRWQREHGASLRAQGDPGNPGASGVRRPATQPLGH
jgi:hypothetical protein